MGAGSSLIGEYAALLVVGMVGPVRAVVLPPMSLHSEQPKSLRRILAQILRGVNMESEKPLLDVDELSALLSTHQARSDRALERISQHIDAHRGYVAWSGGRDSTCVVHLAVTVRPDVPVVWFDSGLEFPDNEEYILRLAEKWGLNFHRIAAVPDALTVLKQTGSWDHNADFGGVAANLHEVLITEPAREAHELFGLGELTGLRGDEAVGRRALLSPGDGHYERKDGTRVFAPIWAWKLPDVNAYLSSHGIPASPVYARLAAVGAPLRAQRVGLVVDGNNPENGRYTFLRAAYPDLWHKLCQELPRLREWR